MATVLSRGQITIVDLHDARQIQAYLNASLGSAQQYNPDTGIFSPNYTASSTHNVVTASIYETGNSTNRIGAAQSVTWTINGTEYTAGTTKNGFTAAADKLTISVNITSGNYFNIVYKAKVPDSITGQLIDVMANMTITKSQSAGALFSVVIQPNAGQIFDQNHTADLTCTAKCFRGGTEDKSGTQFTWHKLVNGAWVDVDTGRASGATLTVKAADVLNFQTYRVTAVDSGNTAYDFITFEDKTDPYQIELFCPTGSTIKNTQGDTRIYARVWQNNTMIESEETESTAQKFTYTWSKYNSAGTKDTTWSKTGNSITVTASEITGKATFICELSKK
jgi:hypothetical protein